MKNLFLLSTLFCFAITSFSCKSNKETSSSATTTTSTTTNEIKKDDAAILNCRVLVSFISKGAGTDSKMRSEFMEYIKSYPKKLDYKTTSWGREGEADYCFPLTELTEKNDIVNFIDRIKKIRAGSDMMIINENTPPPQKGR